MKKRKPERRLFWKYATRLLKVILTILVLILVFQVISNLIKLKDWNDILIKRVNTQEQQLATLISTVEFLELENQRLESTNEVLIEAMLMEVNLSDLQGVSESPPKWEEVDKSIKPNLLNPLGEFDYIAPVTVIVLLAKSLLRTPIPIY